ncbi:MAG: LysR family transcriptional regulator [Sneathiella sp.]
MQDNLSLVQLQTFLWVTSLRSFRKTAEKMNATQPAISSRIAKLEEILGVRLFERETGQIRLTAKGLELLPYAEKMLRTSALLRDRIGDTTAISGILRLGVSETIVHTWLPQFISGLHSKFPDIDVEIMVDATINLRRELMERSLDFAFLMGPVSEFHIENHDLMDFSLIWAASPELDIPTGQQLSLAELAKYPFLTYARNTRPYAEITRQLRQSTELPTRIFPSSSLAAILRMALDGIGIATLPKAMIKRELETGLLQEIKSDWVPSALKFTASYPTDPYNPITEKIVSLALEITQNYQKQV